MSEGKQKGKEEKQMKKELLVNSYLVDVMSVKLSKELKTNNELSDKMAKLNYGKFASLLRTVKTEIPDAFLYNKGEEPFFHNIAQYLVRKKMNQLLECVN